MFFDPNHYKEVLHVSRPYKEKLINKFRKHDEHIIIIFWHSVNILREEGDVINCLEQ